MMFGELDERELQVMRPHMGNCGACQAEEIAMKRMFAVVRTAVRSGGWVPDHFTDTVLSKLRPRTGKRLRHDPLNLRLFRRMVRLAACVLAGVSLVGVYVIGYDHLPHFTPARTLEHALVLHSVRIHPPVTVKLRNPQVVAVKPAAPGN